jgi:hypothetical protein
MGRKGAGRNAFVKATLIKGKDDDALDQAEGVAEQKVDTPSEPGNGMSFSQQIKCLLYIL